MYLKKKGSKIIKATSMENELQLTTYVSSTPNDTLLHMCNHNNMDHNKCNACLVFSCFKVII